VYGSTISVSRPAAMLLMSGTVRNWLHSAASIFRSKGVPLAG
jgi:hypothetical protein